MTRSDKFLFRPTNRQTVALSDMLRDHCSLYNAALQQRRDAYRHPSRASIRYGDHSAQLGQIRKFDPDGQGRWSFSSQQATLRRLNTAFVAFFRRVQAGDKPGYPQFKGVGHFDTVEFSKNGDGCRWNSTPHDRQTRVRLQGVGHVKVHQHRPAKGRVKRCPSHEKDAAGSWCCPATTCPPSCCPRPAARSGLAWHQQITEQTGTRVYFCDAHSPWQRGSNENMNGLLRDYFPRGSDLREVTPEDLVRVADEINHRLRKTPSAGPDLRHCC